MIVEFEFHLLNISGTTNIGSETIHSDEIITFQHF